MKHVLMLSLATALCTVACGDKSHLEMKAREMRQGQLKPGEQKPGTPAEKPSEEGSGTKTMPTNTNDLRILVNGAAIRNILIGEVGLTTTVFCSENLAKAQKEKEKIKLQGNSQIIVRQVVTMVIPEASEPKTREQAAPKTLLSLSCIGASADLSKEPADEDVTIAKLTVGKSVLITGKFSSLQADDEKRATVACVTAKDMAKANDILLPEDKNKTSDILMAAQSKILVETASKDKDLKKYVLVTCDEEAPKTAAVQE